MLKCSHVSLQGSSALMDADAGRVASTPCSRVGDSMSSHHEPSSHFNNIRSFSTGVNASAAAKVAC